MEKIDDEIKKRDSLQKFTNDTLDELEEAINIISPCVFSSDDHYEIIGNRCFYIEDAHKKFQDAKEHCADKFPQNSGKIYEPKSKNHIELMRAALKRRGMNCIWFGITDVANEGTYTYNSDGTLVDENVKSIIQVHDNCGSKDCDYVFYCSNPGKAYEHWSITRHVVCEHGR